LHLLGTMSRKVLVPVLPTERFYDAVVAAAELLGADHGGLLVFLFTDVRPPPLHYEKEGSGRADLAELVDEMDDEPESPELDEWRRQAVEGLEEARDLLRERGIDERNVEYAFADFAIPRSQAIAEEAAAGGYDSVILPAGFVRDGSENAESDPPEEITRELRELGEVEVMVV
jgi:nucleotide-binding universal stress UspA family protein